jgi:hypothetical protein
MSSRILPLIVLAALPGCGRGSAPLPSSGAARGALQAALDTWKAGKTPTALDAATPRVEVVDFEWRAGKALTDYSLGDDAPGQGTKTFSARLTLKGQPPKDVTYMVLGVDPILIYRDADFTRAMNMDNNPSPPRGTGDNLGSRRR